ncbi:MAG: hypothetical protein NT062_04900 [Proteobacteria bacterium]|nr:hypothetical protein [Pseudomonadota bacterium]
MRRFAFSLITSLITPACSGVLQEKIGNSDVDASVVTTIPPPACTAPVTPAESGACLGGGLPGDDCAMCHHQGGTATPFVFSGTLYDKTGTTPQGGATIVLQDASGNVATAVSHPQNGNFYVLDGFVTYPAKAFVTLCPDVLSMVNPVDEATGANCNTAGCHTTGFRVHL